MVKYGMVIDLTKCSGCNACTVACKAENSVPADLDILARARISWNVVLKQETGRFPNVRKIFLPCPCMHCDNPPCVKVCPAGATYKRKDGIIMMDYDKCIGCRYCMVACPYGARHFNWKKPKLLHAHENPENPSRPIGVVEKCTFCNHRIDAGVAKGLKPGVDQEATPACVVTCVGEARYFGDLDDPDSVVSKLIARKRWFRLLEELDTRPRVYYIGAIGRGSPASREVR